MQNTIIYMKYNKNITCLLVFFFVILMQNSNNILIKIVTVFTLHFERTFTCIPYSISLIQLIKMNFFPTIYMYIKTVQRVINN